MREGDDVRGPAGVVATRVLNYRCFLVERVIYLQNFLNLILYSLILPKKLAHAFFEEKT